MQKQIVAYITENPGIQYSEILYYFAPRRHKAGYPKGYSDFAIVYHALEKLVEKGKIRNEGRSFFACSSSEPTVEIITIEKTVINDDVTNKLKNVYKLVGLDDGI